jgi:hypothetical protein
MMFKILIITALNLINLLQSPKIIPYRMTCAPSTVPLDTTIQPVVIKVCDVKRATKPLETVDFRAAMKELFAPVTQVRLTDSTFREIPSEQGLESYSRERSPLIPIHSNGFFDVAQQAYADHRPLVISPDMIWLLICQGFSIHVNQNAEALRKHFVQHEGKKFLIVHRDNFRLGRDTNDWEGVFAEFNTQIAQNTNQNIVQTIAARFSQTDADAAVAFDITLMDAMKSYFDYGLLISCGIPEVVIDGTAADWEAIETRVQKLATYDLEWWIQDLKPILTEFTKAARHEADPIFWKNMIKIQSGQHGCVSTTYLNGWITRFYPYINDSRQFYRNHLIGKPLLMKSDSTKMAYGIQTKQLPSGISSCELLVDNFGNLHKFELKAGFFGMRQDSKTLALRPVIGWAVVNTGHQPDPETIKRYRAVQR